MRNATAPKGRGVASLDGDDVADSKLPKRPKARVMVRLADGSTFRVSGRGARLIRSFVVSYPAGITSLDVWRISTRLASYVHLFRHRHGVPILTIRERHDDGWHARYKLASRIIIESG